MSLPVVLISEEEIQQRVKELATQISEDYADSGDIVLVGVLKGAFIFLADLSRSMTIPRTIEFIAVSSYESGSKSSGAVRLVMDVRANIEGKHVLIVEDIVRLCNELKPQKPVLVGLSIGGLFAAQAIRDGVDAAGLVKIATFVKEAAVYLGEREREFVPVDKR